MREISLAFYCRHLDGRAQWLPQVAPIMERLGRWVGGRTCEDVEQERLAEIWNSMPSELKQLVLTESSRAPWTTLACLMGCFWDDREGWTYKPGDMTADIFGTLVGGHSGTAAEIMTMVKAGLLTSGA